MSTKPAAFLTAAEYPGRTFRTHRGLTVALRYAADTGRAASLVRFALDEHRAGNHAAALAALDKAATVRPKLARAVVLARAGSWTSARRVADGWTRDAERARLRIKVDPLDFAM